MIVEDNADFIGSVVGGGGLLEIAPDDAPVTLSGLGGAVTMTGAASGVFTGFGTYVVGGGAAVTLGYGGDLAAGKSFSIKDRAAAPSQP